MVLYNVYNFVYRDYAATVHKKKTEGDIRYHVCTTYVYLRLTCLYDTVPLKSLPSGKLDMSSDHGLNLIG